MRLKGRVGVVTGAGRGLGKKIATHLAAEGMDLMLLARTGAQVRSHAQALSTTYGVQAFPAAIDVTDAAAVDQVVLHAEQHSGPVDLLVNNAAIIESRMVPFWDAEMDELSRVVETNLRGPMLIPGRCCRRWCSAATAG